MKTFWILVIVIALGVIGFYFYKQNVLVFEPKETVVALSEQNSSGQSGTATFTPTADGRVMVALQLMGVSATATEPAHIHSGSCRELGPIVYDLDNIKNGEGQVVLVASDGHETTWLELVAQLPLAINVHAGEDQPEIGMYTMCGDVKL